MKKTLLVSALLLTSLFACAQSSRGFAVNGSMYSIVGKGIDTDFSKKASAEFFIDRNTDHGFFRVYAGAIYTPKSEGIKATTNAYFNFLGGYQFGKRFQYYGSAGAFFSPTGDMVNIGPSAEIGWGIKWVSLTARANYGLVDMDKARAKTQSTLLLSLGIRATVDIED